MSQPLVGQIVAVGFTFAPAGWQSCDGSLLPISEYETLFNLIGTTYGGDGQSTFAVPDLRGRTPIHMGTGAGLSSRTLAETGGVEQVTLTTNQVPSHSHAVTPAASSAQPTRKKPGGAYPALGGYYDSTQAGGLVAMGGATVASSGGGQPHDNLQPLLVVNYIISLFGVFPSPA